MTFRQLLVFATPGREAAAALAAVFMLHAAYSAGPVYLAVTLRQGTGDAIRTGLLVFVALYFAPYLITYGAALAKVRWRTKARKAVWLHCLHAVEGKTSAAFDKNAATEFATIVTSNAQDAAMDAVAFLYDSASLFFSCVITLALIASFIDSTFVWSYATSAMLCVLLWRGTSNWQTDLFARGEKGLNLFLRALPHAWLAASLPEPEVLVQHKAMAARRWARYRKTAIAATRAFQGYNIAQALCIWGPALLTIWLRSDKLSLPELGAWAVILPRLTESLLDLSKLVANAGEYLGLRGRIRWIDERLSQFGKQVIAPRVSYSSLSVCRAEQTLAARDFAELRENLPTCGRITIRGPNGSGKSTLLLLLKDCFGTEALLAPAGGGLLPRLTTGTGSTGESQFRELTRLLHISGKHVLLLDEWNSNLDADKARKVDRLLDEAATTRLVVEVLHSRVNT